MTCNVGNLDRLIRLVVGTGLFLLPFASGWGIWANDLTKYVVAVFAAVLALASALRICPLYRIFGLNTCRM